MPTVVTTSRGTGTLNTETRRARDVSPSLFQLDPMEGPLLQMLGQVKKREATDPKIEWFEDELNPRHVALSASLTAAATTMSVDNPTYLRAGDLLKAPSGEVIRVGTTPTANPVTIVRAVGETSGVAASSGDSLFIFSNAHAEGAGKRALLSTQRVPVFNYCQIIRTGFGWTETAKATKQFAGQDPAEEKAKKLLEQKRDIEQSLWFGERAEDTSGTHPRRMSRGIFQFITTNSKNVANLTEEEFEDYMRVCFRYNSSAGAQKVFFGSPLLMTVMNRWARGRLQTVNGEQSYGVTMTELQSAGRKVRLVEHPLFTNDNLNDLTGKAGYGATLDMADLELRYMRGKIVGLRENIQTPGDDLEEHEYVSEVGLEMHLEKRHGELTGVTN